MPENTNAPELSDPTQVDPSLLPPVPDWISEEVPWQERFKRLWMLTRLGHEGFMMEKIQRQTQDARAIQEFAVTGDKNAIAGKIGPKDDGMGVSIGNDSRSVHYHMQGGTSTTQGAGASLATTAAKALGVGAIGAAALAGYQYFASDNDAPVDTTPPPAAVDTDTNAGLRFGA